MNKTQAARQAMNPQGYYHQVRKRLKKVGLANLVRELVDAMCENDQQIVVWPDGVFLRNGDLSGVVRQIENDWGSSTGTHEEHFGVMCVKVNFRGRFMVVRLRAEGPGGWASWRSVRVPLDDPSPIIAALVVAQITGRRFQQ